jgi:ribonuclease T2
MKVLILVCLSLCVAQSSQRPSDSVNNGKPVHGGNNNFDYLILREIWPASSCMFPGANTCQVSQNVSTWVVHGLWPSIKSEIGPQFCNKTMPFNFNLVKPILDRLLRFWPNLYTNTPLASFWQHEWEKHGTCALGLPQIKSEFDYFNTTLGLRDHYDFGPMLAGANVVPDDTIMYDLDKIESAITKTLGIRPLLTCYVEKDADVQYFSQMQICISKQFELVDCQTLAVEPALIARDNSAQETTCQRGMPVHYPTIKYAQSGASKLNFNL